MGRKKKKDVAIGLATSMRGQWIIGRALRKAYLQMDESPIERKEVSDMSDMKLIGEELFFVGWHLEDVVQKDITNGVEPPKLFTNDKEEKGPIQDQSDADQGV